MKSETIEALQKLCRELQGLAQAVSSFAGTDATEGLLNAAERLHNQLYEENKPQDPLGR